MVVSLPIPSQEFTRIIYNRRYNSNGLNEGIYSKFYGLPFLVPEDRHRWWFTYDDTNNLIIASKRNQLIDPFITVSTAKIFEKIFRESLVIELAWEERIEYKIDNKIREEDFKKISFFKLIRKYFSKKTRSLFK